MTDAYTDTPLGRVRWHASNLSECNVEDCTETHATKAELNAWDVLDADAWRAER